MTKQQTQDDRHVSLMAHDQYVRSVKWTACAGEGEEEHLLQRIERGNAERHKACPDGRVCQDAEAARERLVAIYYTDRPVRLPAYLCQALFQMRRVRSRLFETLGREPLLAEMAAELAFTEERVLELKEYERRGNAESLQAVVGEYEEEEEIFDFVSVFAATVAAETARQEELQTIVRQAMETGLTPRLREVVTLRYGLDGGERYRVVDLARELGLKVHSVDVSIIRAKRHLQAVLAAPCAKYYDDSVA